MEYYSKLERIAKNYIVRPIKIVALATSLCLTNKAYSRDIYIPQDYSTIQVGIDSSVNGDSVIVLPGKYNELIDFKGKAITLKSSDGRDKTIIDGFGLNDSVVKCIRREGQNTILDGFTVTGGNGSLVGSYLYGGGMLVIGSSPEIKNCIFRDNKVATNGGGIYIMSGDPTIINCEFNENLATNGGGMYNDRGSVSIFNSIFYSNKAGNDGGGIRTGNYGDIWLNNCTFTANTGVGNGLLSGSFSFINNCIFWDNNGGGGISSSDTNPEIFIFYSNIQGGAQGTGNINADPSFVDSESGDFHLQSNSPCVDSGDPGFRDPDGTRSDMGALFYDRRILFQRILFIRGDSNLDREFDIADPIYTILYLFYGLEARCLDASDANDDGKVNITDPIYMLSSLFKGENGPSPPFPEAGVDPTIDNLSCENY